VTRVSETPIGGKVVWLRDAERNASIYYAHLDSQYVAAGARVQPGDTLGTVGNTGNARTTPPHLHFGIYARGEGPVDPYPWVYVPRRTPAALAVDTTRFDRWVRVSGASGTVREGPGVGSPTRFELPRHSALHVSGGNGGWYRVRAPDGATGYIAASAVQPADAPFERLAASAAVVLRDAPLATAARVDSVRAGSSFAVLGRFNGFALVRNDDGREVWLEITGP
jgi:peptidoglycan LD-endopeptidase LytH